MRIATLMLVVTVVLMSALPSAQAQNPAGATETTQIMNFMQLMQMAFTAENQLRMAQSMVMQAETNAKRLSRGDVLAIRDSVYHAMSVQSMVLGLIMSQRSMVQTIEQSYPSPEKLDSRFQTWQQYHRHLDQVERENHRTYKEAAEVLDKQLIQGLREDTTLLQKLREKAGSAETEAQQLQVTNQILLELVRQMHQLRIEGMAATRMQLLTDAADSQRRTAEHAVNRQQLQRATMPPPSSFPGYSVGGR